MSKITKSYLYTVHRIEADGIVTYEVYDERPDPHRFVCSVSESEHDRRSISAKNEAEIIARALNLMTALAEFYGT